MNTRAFTLSLVMAGIAMFMVYSYMEGRETTYIEKYGKESSVVKARVDIGELELLDDSKVYLDSVPHNFLSPGHIKDVKEIFNTIATMPILKGEQITKPRITLPGARTGLARQISSGKRAFPISVDDSSGVSRLIKPGDRVDIIAKLDPFGGQVDLIEVNTVLQDVLVLSTGLSMTNAVPIVNIKERGTAERQLKLNSYTTYGTVTLELDPFQVQKIVFLINLGARPYLSLRNNDDKKIIRIKSTKVFDLLSDPADAKARFAKQREK